MIGKEPSSIGYMSEQKPKTELEVKKRKAPPSVLLSPISPLTMKQSVIDAVQTNKSNPHSHQLSSSSRERNINVYIMSLT